MKFELIPKKSLFRPRALIDFEAIDGTLIKKGDVGGLISKDVVIPQDDRSWVDYDSRVVEGVKLRNTAVKGQSFVFGNIHFNSCVIQNCSIENTLQSRLDFYKSEKLAQTTALLKNFQMISSNYRFYIENVIDMKRNYSLVDIFSVENRFITLLLINKNCEIKSESDKIIFKEDLILPECNWAIKCK